MTKVQFRILYREFLFRIVDLELLSAHAEGDSRRLLGQFASLLLFFSVVLAAWAGVWGATAKDERLPPLVQVIGAWNMEHFLIATTMLAVGLFAVLSWESTFPDRRDLLVLGPLPVRARTLFLAKVAAVASALGLTLAALHAAAGIGWPLALAQYDSTPVPALVFDPALPPVGAADFPSVMNRDIAPMLGRLGRAAANGGAGIVIGVSERGVRRILTYGAAKTDSLFEIGSISKTFTGLLLAQMAVQGKLDLRDHAHDYFPPGAAAASRGFEITLLDLATHHSGLPVMPDNPKPGDLREKFTNYHASDLTDFIKRNGLGKPADTKFLYSNLGFTVLGAALENRAQTTFPKLLEEGITGPLGMKDTSVSLSPGQLARLMQGHDGQGRPIPRWDLDAFASAGGIRATAADMLIYLEAQLHSETTPFAAALVESQRLRGYVAGHASIALAWMHDNDSGIYSHSGATGGFTSYAFFTPRRDFAGVVFLNARSSALPDFPFLCDHVRQRLAGEPAFSLTSVPVPPTGPIRSFFAYWVTMVSAGVFIFCCVLATQGLAAQLLPRRWFLRVSTFLQLAVFCLFVSAYCLQQSPVFVLINGPRQSWISWIPSYWFAGLYQQLSGSLHPALAPFARRAWIGLIVAVCATAIAYAACYLRTLRKIVEEPDISPCFKNAWLPRLGGALETAIAQFAIRSLLRSRQHRMIFAFYLGVGLAFAILFMNAPLDLSGPTAGDPWRQPSVPLLAATIVMMGFWVVGVRVVFSLPLDLRANWIFRVMPFRAGRRCLGARRRALYALSVGPAWAVSAAVLLVFWPWRPAAFHLAVLGLLGVVLAEISFGGAQKIPFTCSYLPGRSHIHVTFLLWLYVVGGVVMACAMGEFHALERPEACVAILVGMGAAALFTFLQNNWLAQPSQAELRFEETPADQLLSLELS